MQNSAKQSLADLESILSQLEHLELQTGFSKGLLPQKLHFLHSGSYPTKVLITIIHFYL